MTDAARPEGRGTGMSAFVCMAAIVATGYTTPTWLVGSVTRLGQSDSREDLGNRVDSKVVEHIACYIGKRRCNLI